MKFLFAFIVLQILTSICCIAQSVEQVKASIQATEELKRLVKSAYFVDITIRSESVQQGLQTLCNKIGEQYSLSDEEKVLFTLNSSPSKGPSTAFSAKLKDGAQLVDLFCQHHGLKSVYRDGRLHFNIDQDSEKQQRHRSYLKKIEVPKTSITSTYLPQAVRKLLVDHDLTFSIHCPDKNENKDKPIPLEKIRISIFESDKGNLFDLLDSLAKEVDLQLVVDANGILFLPKSYDFTVNIKPQHDKKPLN